MHKNDSKPITFIPTECDSNRAWRFERPVWDTDTCIRCGVCYLACPDSAIFRTSEGYFDIHEALCKGCGVCARQCVTGCLTMLADTARAPWLTKTM